MDDILAIKKYVVSGLNKPTEATGIQIQLKQQIVKIEITGDNYFLVTNLGSMEPIL